MRTLPNDRICLVKSAEILLLTQGPGSGLPASLFQETQFNPCISFLGDTIQSMLVFSLKALGMRTSLSQPERAPMCTFSFSEEKRHLSRAEFPSALSRSSPQPFLPPQPGSHPGEAKRLGSVLRQAHAHARGQERLPGFCGPSSSEENMLFWMACGAEESENKAMIEEKARVISEDYISILSP